MKIRQYRQSDRKAVEHIHLMTGLLSRPMKRCIDDEKLYAKEVEYYLDKEPGSIFVLEDGGRVVGYVLGCLDDTKGDSVFKFLLKKFLIMLRIPFMAGKDRTYWGRIISVMFSALMGRSDEARFRVPKNSGHIHIELLPGYRGKGMGTRLLNAFLRYARSHGVKRIHADSFQTRLNPNTNFWMKNGFKEYCRIKTVLYKRYYPKEDIYLVCYSKEL